ncbi:MAG: polyribonucleotide nucleotidyltransferase [Chloroflexi bacterium]|nr:MAG: polyribonucleotide nucleotidyltransferase [Chloroflexota bacterium]
MKPESKKYTAVVDGKELMIETGTLAEQAGGAVTVRMGDSVILGTATMSDSAREGADFFPLTVNYEERMYANGSIPGSFFRREGRPGEDATLTCRLIDRPLRPMFPKDLRNDVQLILYALSSDDQPMDVLGINAASAALVISDIPWDGPIAGIRVGRIDGKFIAFPTFDEIEESDLDLVMAGSRDAILTVESNSKELSEEVILEALEWGQKAIQPLIDAQEKMAREIGKEKRSYLSFKVSDELKAEVKSKALAPINEVLEKNLGKVEFRKSLDAVRDEILESYAENEEVAPGDVKEAFEDVLKSAIRNRILETGKRSDGRDLTTVRDIWCEVNISPRPHGVGLFTRGQTQVMTMTTLGTPRDAQMIDNLSPTDTKRYMHHYNFPPFSVGEVRFLRGTSRREVGHGALAERALLPVLPSEEEFPYTMRLVSEVLSSNGSSSMASVCGSTLSLMDTGVPIKAPVAGVAMGLVKEGDRYAILTDIQGLEDHIGNMDFKVAGTDQGITALQMDIKLKGLSSQVMAEALEQAKAARSLIMSKMLETISEPREDLKPHVPRIEAIRVPVDKIGAIIGPGGKIIREIQEDTGAKIDIDDDGLVYIATDNAESARLAKERIEGLTATPEVGRIYTGRVVGIKTFGAFVEILPGIDGLVHISQLESSHVKNVEDVVDFGDEITVMVTDISKDGKIRLSRQAVLEGWSLEEAQKADRKK